VTVATRITVARLGALGTLGVLGTRAMLGGLGMLGVLGGCTHGGGDAPIANHGKPGATSEVRAVDWQNHTYVLDELGAVTVKAGHADFGISDDNKAVEAGGANGSYEVQRPLFADVDGDGVEDAVISGVLSTGGTGHFSDVRIYTMRGGRIVELGTIPGGDRGDGGIRKVALDGNAVIVDRNVLAEGDGACCASRWQRERWSWRNGAMTEDTAARGPLTPAP
jgi:hypothetical protein